jgi:hypothetical protein
MDQNTVFFTCLASLQAHLGGGIIPVGKEWDMILSAMVAYSNYELCIA